VDALISDLQAAGKEQCGQLRTSLRQEEQPGVSDFIAIREVDGVQLSKASGHGQQALISNILASREVQSGEAIGPRCQVVEAAVGYTCASMYVERHEGAAE
jgi:hypothetical protein